MRTMSTIICVLILITTLMVVEKHPLIAPLMASRIISPYGNAVSSINGRGDLARALYFLANGPGTNFSLTNPPNGFTFYINDWTSAIGRGIEAQGIKGCANIPGSGKFSAVVTTSAGDQLVTISFGTAVMKVPSHFQFHGGEAFGKRITVAQNGVNFMIYELDCDADDRIRTGYVLTSGNGFGARNFEAYFQVNGITSASNVDMLEVSSDSTKEVVAIRFLTGDGDHYNLWTIRTTNGTIVGGDYIGIGGTASLARARVNSIHVTNSVADSSLISSPAAPTGNTDCIDFSADVAASTSGCNGVGEPTPGTVLYGNARSPLVWTISGVAGASISTVQ